jgi:signal transduction histidine kinase
MLTLRRFAGLPIRRKLLLLVLLPLAVVLPLLVVLLALWSDAAFGRLLITKVRSDLAVAHGYFERVLGEVGASADAMAGSHVLHRLLPEGGADLAVASRRAGEALPRLLADFRRRGGLDFVLLRDAEGRLVAADRPLLAAATDAQDRLPPLPPDGRAGGVMADLAVLSAQQLAALGADLPARARVRLVPTRNAAPTDRDAEDRALVVLATAPLRDAAGRVRGHLQAGLLLNRNLAFIDHVNEIVYPAGALPFGSRGTATLFLDDVRVSTNVRLFGGEDADRAIGTRVSATVREAVLGRGGTWLDRAFVVDDWYVSAYQPLTDAAGARVGMLYVGFLEKPFTWVKWAALAGIGLVFLAVMLAAAWLSLRAARLVSGSVEQMARTMARVEAGDGAARVGAVRVDDELGQLAGHLDHLLGVIADNTRELQAWNAELDAKVAERTRELAQAQRLLVRNEKMVAVGQLTASIAHEINNPIAVIQGNLDLLRELLPPAMAAQVRTEIDLVDQQVERMRLIVTRLLQFARPGEYAGYAQPVDLAALMEESLGLVGPALGHARIEVRRELHATRRPVINRGELQQVLVNLLVNAVQAMPEGGTLTLGTADLPEGGVDLRVADTGPGLDEGLLAELFQPFVTHKKDGTGLGLWISRGIVERYDGTLTAGAREDGQRGACFRVRLPDTAARA